MPTDPKEILDDSVDGREALKLSGRLEAAYLPLALPRRLWETSARSFAY